MAKCRETTDRSVGQHAANCDTLHGSQHWASCPSKATRDGSHRARKNLGSRSPPRSPQHPCEPGSLALLLNCVIVQLYDGKPGSSSRQIDLSSYAGVVDLVVEFRFDSIDEFANGFRGWQVDDVRIEVSSVICNACPCACDFDPDPACNIFDFLAFQNLFVAGDPCACDYDPDPACNIFDFLAFQNEFVAGCP